MSFAVRSMFAAFVAFSAASSPAPLLAAPGHSAANGGQVQQIGPYEVELVVKGTDVSLYVLDSQDKQVDVAKFTAVATVLAKGNEQKAIDLRPAGGNRLAGKVDFAVDGKFRATVSLRTPAGEAGKGRYSLDPGR